MSVKRFSSTSIMNLIKVLHKKNEMSNWFKAHHSFQYLLRFHLICHQIVIDLWQREFAYPSYVTCWDPRLHLNVFKNVWSFNKNLGPKKKSIVFSSFFIVPTLQFQGNQAWPGGSPWQGQATKRPPFVLSLPKRPSFWWHSKLVKQGVASEEPGKPYEFVSVDGKALNCNPQKLHQGYRNTRDAAMFKQVDWRW